MEEIKTVYDVLNHFKNTKRRLTQGGNSDFITIDYKQLLALIELAKREQQELSIANDKLKKIEEYVKENKDYTHDFTPSSPYYSLLEIIKGGEE